MPDFCIFTSAVTIFGSFRHTKKLAINDHAVLSLLFVPAYSYPYYRADRGFDPQHYFNHILLDTRHYPRNPGRKRLL